MDDRRRLVDRVILILAAWAVLAFLARVLRIEDTPQVFPMSMFSGPRIVWAGLPYAAAFLVVLWAALKVRLTIGVVLALCVGLLVLGNLVQGGFFAGFVLPLVQKVQYYIDAARIADWRDWLRSFTSIQYMLTNHSRSHPPFAVLVHYWLRWPQLASVIFTAATSACFVLVWRIAGLLGTGGRRALWLTLLFAVTPAVNIYGAVVLDGVILAASTLFLLGLIRLSQDERWNWTAFAQFALGLLLTNALSFGGLFLVGVAAVWAFRRRDVARALLYSLAVGAVCYIVLRAAFGYDHIAAFVNASRLENPEGFRAFATPAHYFLTRIENVADIALFLSIPTLAVMLRRKLEPITLTGVVVLGAMFLAGAYRTGETARACLFIYPYLILGLRDLSESWLRWLTVGAGLQSVIMQVLGHYYW